MSTQGKGDVAHYPAGEGLVSSLIPFLARAHRNLAGALLRDVGLSPGQELLLMLLWEHEPRSQSEITRMLRVERPTATRTLARMEKAGLIVRGESASDGRVVLVSLTDRGRALEDPVRAVWRDLEDRTVADLSAQEQEQLVALLERVSASVVTARDEQDPAQGPTS